MFAIMSTCHLLADGISGPHPRTPQPALAYKCVKLCRIIHAACLLIRTVPEFYSWPKINTAAKLHRCVVPIGVEHLRFNKSDSGVLAENKGSPTCIDRPENCSKSQLKARYILKIRDAFLTHFRMLAWNERTRSGLNMSGSNWFAESKYSSRYLMRFLNEGKYYSI